MMNEKQVEAALKLALEAFEADASNENFLVLKHCVREALAEQPAPEEMERIMQEIWQDVPGAVNFGVHAPAQQPEYKHCDDGKTILKNPEVLSQQLREHRAQQQEPDAYNRKLRQQLEQEWVDLRKLREAQQQEPVAKVCHDLDGHIGWNPKLTQLPDEGTSLYISSQPSKPLTDGQRKAIVVCFTSGKVSVSEVQRKLAISYNEAQQLCQSIVDLGLAEGLQLAPSLDRHGIKGDA